MAASPWRSRSRSRCRISSPGCSFRIAGQVRIGDYVKLDSGAEGYLVDFNWRSARLRQLGDNIVLVPNSKLSQAIVTNYSLPAAEMSIGVDFIVDRASDLALVERVALEVGQASMKEVAGARAHGRCVRAIFRGFADIGIRVSIGLRVRHFVDQFRVKHEVIKRLQARLMQENIRIR